MIDQRATVEGKVTIADNAYVGPGAVLWGGPRMDSNPGIDVGSSVYIGPNVVVTGSALIGSGSKLFPGVVVGEPGEHRLRSSVQTDPVVIGRNVHLREQVVVQRSLKGGRLTEIGDGSLIMCGAYIAHNSVVDEDVTIAPGACLAGYSAVLRGANVGMNAALHQYTTVGAYAMIGMGSVVVDDVLPFVVAFGSPARAVRINDVGLDRFGVDFEKDWAPALSAWESERALAADIPENAGGLRQIALVAPSLRRTLLRKTGSKRSDELDWIPMPPPGCSECGCLDGV